MTIGTARPEELLGEVQTSSRATSKKGRGNSSRSRVPMWFVLPGLAIFVAFVIVPTAIGVYYSFTDATSATGGDFIGLENYLRVFQDPQGWPALVRTLIIAVVVTTVQNVVALLLALALNSSIRSRHFLRVVFFLPFVLAPLVVGYVWQLVLANEGALNGFLQAIGLGELAQSWLGHPDTAFISIMVVMVWQFTGSTMVIYLAGLQGVPKEVLEAASLDGSSGARTFWFVVRPFLAPAITVNLTLTLIGTLRVYDQIISLTKGGPAGSTESISTLIVKYGFSFGEFGYGAAFAVLLSVFVLIASGVQYLVLRKQASA